MNKTNVGHTSRRLNLFKISVFVSSITSYLESLSYWPWIKVFLNASNKYAGDPKSVHQAKKAQMRTG
jgi:hypothetical protein